MIYVDSFQKCNLIWNRALLFLIELFTAGIYQERVYVHHAFEMRPSFLLYSTWFVIIFSLTELLNVDFGYACGSCCSVCWSCPSTSFNALHSLSTKHLDHFCLIFERTPSNMLAYSMMYLLGNNCSANLPIISLTKIINFNRAFSSINIWTVHCN